MNLSNSGTLFNLQAGLTLDTSAYESAVDSAISDAESLESAIANITDSIEITAAVKKDDTELEALNGELDEFAQREDTSDADVDADSTELETLNGKLDSFAERSESAGALVAADDAELVDLENELETFDASSAEADAAIAGDDSELETLNDELDEYGARAETAEAAVDADDGELAELERELDDYDDIAATADADVAADDSELTDLIGELETLTESEYTVDVTVSASTGAVEEVGDAIADLGADGASGTASAGIESLTNLIKTGLAGAGTFMAISGVYNAVKDLVSEVAGAGDAIDKGADRLQMTNKEYQVWDQILQHCGSDISALKRAMNRIMDPTEDAAAAMSKLNLPEDFATRDTAGQFEAVIEGLQGIDDETERSKLALDIFGQQWTQFATLIQQSPEQMAAMKETASALAMSDEMVNASAAWTDASQDLSTAFLSLKTTLLEETGILPTLTGFMNGITDIIKEFQKEGLEETITGIGKSFTQTISDINSQELNATAIINAMDALGDPELFTEADQAQWDALYEELCKVMPEMKTLYGDQAEATKGATDALREHLRMTLADAKAQALAKAITEQNEAIEQAYKDQIVAQAKYSTATEKVALIEQSDAYKSAVVKREALANGAEWSYDYYTKEEQDALNARTQAMFEATQAQEEYNKVSAETEKIISEQQAIVDAMYEMAGLTPETLGTLSEEAASAATTVSECVDEITEDLNSVVGDYDINVNYNKTGNMIPDGSHANGLDYVPFDGYIAELHKGERVLTASENSAYNAGGTIDYEALAAALSARPISFAVGDTALATSIAGASSRANAQRTAEISTGYGRGLF